MSRGSHCVRIPNFYHTMTIKLITLAKIIIMTRSRKRNRPNNDTWVAKENITLWDFQRGKDPNKIQCSK